MSDFTKKDNWIVGVLKKGDRATVEDLWAELAEAVKKAKEEDKRTGRIL